MNDYNNAGVIYILTNKAFSNLVKIGYADDLNRRVNQLNSSDALPYPFEVYAYYGVPCRLTDLKLHNLIDKLNPSLRTRSEVNGRTRVREFFELSPEDAYSILEAIAEITDTKEHLFLIEHNASMSEHRVKVQKNIKNQYDEPIKANRTIKRNAACNVACDDISDKVFDIVSTFLSAKMRVSNGNFVALANSQLQFPNGPSLQGAIVKLRETLQRENKIIIEGNIGTLLCDVSFSSPSAAAKFVFGTSRDGWVYWKDVNGNLIDAYRNRI